MDKNKLPPAKGQFKYQKLEEEKAPTKKTNLPVFFYNKKKEERLLDGDSKCGDRRSGLR